MEVSPHPFYPSTEQWEDVDYSPKKIICHVCSGETTVKQGHVTIYSRIEEQRWPGLEKRHLVNFLFNCRAERSWTYWQLCQACYNQGWRPPEEVLWGHLLYTNSVTKENRAV